MTQREVAILGTFMNNPPKVDSTYTSTLLTNERDFVKDLCELYAGLRDKESLSHPDSILAYNILSNNLNSQMRNLITKFEQRLQSILDTPRKVDYLHEGIVRVEWRITSLHVTAYQEEDYFNIMARDSETKLVGFQVWNKSSVYIDKEVLWVLSNYLRNN